MAINAPDPVVHKAAVSLPGRTSNEDTSSYYDVLVIGRTGLGKSTLGNKILGIDPETKTLLIELEPGEDKCKVIKRWEFDSDKKPYFETGGKTDSVTKRCKVLSNEKSLNRVLDTRGFADSEITRRYGVMQGNIQCFRWILQAQKEYGLHFSRVVYFLPYRGPAPERAEGTLQEEIKVMYGFFGQKIFDIMVVIVTQKRDIRYQNIGFNDEDIRNTEEVFITSFQKVTETSLPKCPPIIYIPFDADHKFVTDGIVGAPVISDAHKLTYSLEFPFKKIETRGVSFQFEDRCTRCAIKLVFDKLETGEEIPNCVVKENGSKEEYDHSYCHPLFIPKYTTYAKVLGGLVHIVTLGTGLLVKAVFKDIHLWPGFTNADEVCVHCKNPPGSDSCWPVHRSIEIAGEHLVVDHSRELDTIKVYVTDSTTTAEHNE